MRWFVVVTNAAVNQLTQERSTIKDGMIGKIFTFKV